MQCILDLALNKDAKVCDVTLASPARERILELGLSPGREVRLLRRLPFGGPVIVQAGTLFLALRREEAAGLWVED